MDLLADRLGIDPLELRLQNVLRDGDGFCTGETMHDVHFADCLERAADAVGWRDGPARQGALRAPEGHADAEPGLDRRRGRRRTAATRCAARRPRWARARGGRSRSSPPSCSASRPARSRFPDPDTDARPLRHAHDLEPLDLHDGPGARGGRARPPRATARAASARSATRAGSTPTPARASPRRTGTRARPPPRCGSTRRPGKVEVVRLHAAGLRGAGRQPARRRAAERGLDDHGPRHGALRGGRVRRRPGRRTPTCPTTRSRRSPTCRSD